MKSQKGVTLISLTIYIIVMSIVIGVIGILSTFFYKNINNATENIDPVTQYTKFNTFFTEEVNHENIKVLECKPNYVVFDNDVQYTFIEANQGIYRNKVKISSKIETCTFEHAIKNGKNVITVTLKAVNGTEKTQTYTLKN